MSDTKWTNGLWEIVERSDTWNIKAGNRCIARLQMKDGVLYDAHLIVAAPGLYEELEISTDNIETLAIRLDKEPGNQIVVGAMMHRVRVNRAALARARGEETK